MVGCAKPDPGSLTMEAAANRSAPKPPGPENPPEIHPDPDATGRWIAGKWVSAAVHPETFAAAGKAERLYRIVPPGYGVMSRWLNGAAGF